MKIGYFFENLSCKGIFEEKLCLTLLIAKQRNLLNREVCQSKLNILDHKIRL